MRPSITPQEQYRRALLAKSRLKEEEAIHRAVVELLQVSAVPGVAWTHMPAGEVRPISTGKKLKAMGTKPGWPDIILVKGGHFYGLELKTEDGRLSPAQVAAHEALAAAGATVAVAYGLDQSIEILKGWGLIR